MAAAGLRLGQDLWRWHRPLAGLSAPGSRLGLTCTAGERHGRLQIAARHTWLARTDFTTRCLHAGTRHDGHHYAWIDWQSAITALDTCRLSCTGSEAAILRIAASLGDPGIPVHLARIPGSLDRRNIQLVTAAITRANG